MEIFPPDTLRRFLGGSGLGTWLLLELQSAEVDPLAAEAPIAFSFSPLVGSPLTTSAKLAVVSKSPLTWRLNDSLAGSGFALAGKRTGADAIVIVGRAARPSVLVVDESQVWLEPANQLWGDTCSRTQSRLKQHLGSDYELAVIGPAGENLVRYATISHAGRHAGRGGSGAVLAQNLKAIAVRGSQRTIWADPAGLATYAKELSRRSFGPATAKYRELGTASNLLVFNRLAALPTRNFQQGRFEGVEALAPETLTQARQRTRRSCACCTIGCEHIYALQDHAPVSESGGVRVEYENLFALGPLCGIDDPQVVLQASQKCDELGLDTISAGGTIAFAMECAQRGWFAAPGLRFGQGTALLETLDAIALRRGIGQHLAEGSRRLAEHIGHNSIDFAPQVKGLEIPAYEPRALQTMALGFAVGSRGADHNRSGAYEADFSEQVDRRAVTADHARRAVETEDRAALIDSLILCKFLRGALDDFYGESAEMLRKVTGWTVTGEELQQTARRMVTAKKVFNIQTGWTACEDTLPARFLTKALPEDDRARLSPQQLASAVAAYYAARGWTRSGAIPTQQLRQLGLAPAARRESEGPG